MTDPDSAKMKTSHGVIQGYNARLRIGDRILAPVMVGLTAVSLGLSIAAIVSRYYG